MANVQKHNLKNVSRGVTSGAPCEYVPSVGGAFIIGKSPTRRFAGLPGGGERRSGLPPPAEAPGGVRTRPSPGQERCLRSVVGALYRVSFVEGASRRKFSDKRMQSLKQRSKD